MLQWLLKRTRWWWRRWVQRGDVLPCFSVSSTDPSETWSRWSLGSRSQASSYIRPYKEVSLLHHARCKSYAKLWFKWAGQAEDVLYDILFETKTSNYLFISNFSKGYVTITVVFLSIKWCLKQKLSETLFYNNVYYSCLIHYNVDIY